MEHFVREMGGVQSFVTFKKEVTNNRYNNVGVKVNAVILESGRPTAVKAARRLKDRLYKVGIIPTVDIKFVTVEE
ncbi:MAG: hypothetical protein OYG31_00090 [Candidatus Kaiserbacteria bacterium]|nr:hypothetical protein [Candidatus Kaiserbacteria bacterium]